MKKLLLSLMTLLCIGSAAVADTETITFSKTNNLTVNDDGSKGILETDNFRFTVNRETAQNAVATDFAELRVYKNSTLTLEGLKGEKISKIEITASGKSYVGFNSCNVGSGSWTASSPYIYTWEGDATSVTLTSGSSATRITKAVITYTPGEADAVAMPTFEVVEVDEYSSLVEISCDTEDTSIYYTLDGNDPTDASTLYDDTEMIEVYTGITTIKAIAYNKDGEHSKVATTVVEIPYILDSFSALSDFPADQDMKVIFKDAVFTIVYQNGANLYVKDAYGNYMLFYKSGQPAYSNGDTFNSANGTYTVYNGQPEIKDFTLGEVTTGGEAVNPTGTTIGMIGGFTMNQYFAIENVAITGVSGKNGTMTDADGGSVALYDKFSVDGFANTEKNVTVTGFVGKNFDTVQFLPISIVEYVDPYSAPTFDPADGSEVGRGQEIKLTAGEGAEIYWRMVYPEGFEDYNEEEFALYEGVMYEIVVPYMQAIKSFTVEAYAKYGEEVTETVSATYTIGKNSLDLKFIVDGEEVTEYTMNFGDELNLQFEGLEALDDSDFENLELTSSDEEVVVVDWDMMGFKVVGPGQTTLTISVPENAQHQAGTATLDLTVIDPNASEATIDFVNNNYGMTLEQYNKDGDLYVAVIDGTNIDMTVNSKTRLWSDGLRFYSGGEMTVTIPGAKINSVSFDADSKNQFSLYIDDKTTAETNSSFENGSADSFTIKRPSGSSGKAVKTITIAYTKIVVPEGAHNFAAEEIEDGETSVLVVKGVHAESELYYRFTPDQQTEIVTYAESHEGFTKSEVFEAAEDNTNTHRIEVSAPGTYELYTYHAASDTKSEVAEVKVKATTGVNGIEIDSNDADVEYYNLQGIRVDNPANGLYIRRQGNTTTKVIL